MVRLGVGWTRAVLHNPPKQPFHPYPFNVGHNHFGLLQAVELDGPNHFVPAKNEVARDKHNTEKRTTAMKREIDR